MKKILSIDGGGIRGIIPAMVLAAIEEKTGIATAENFDLIAGTSTGGILALGLSVPDDEGNPRYSSAADLADIYARRGREIFQNPRGLFGQLFEERYSHEGLENVLGEYFRQTLLGEASTKTMVTAYDIQAREPLFLKSWEPQHVGVRMRDAARATSAAPTFFEPIELCVGSRMRTLVDGGVFINTPSVSAYAEAIEVYSEEEFFILSIGTGQLTREFRYEEAQDWGLAKWIRPLLYFMFDGMSDAAHYQMRRFLGDDNYIHLQVSLGRPNGTENEVANDDMDNVRQGNINNLRRLAEQVIASDDFNAVCERLTPREEASE